jgi:hypothetical protein
MMILKVERVGAYNREDWRIETLARKKTKGGPQHLPLQLQSQKVSTRS